MSREQPLQSASTRCRQDMTYLNLARYLDQFRGKFPVFSDDIQGATRMSILFSAHGMFPMLPSLSTDPAPLCCLRSQQAGPCPGHRAYPPAWPAAGMAAVVLGGVMAAQPLTGRSLAQHTYMFAGEVRCGRPP